MTEDTTAELARAYTDSTQYVREIETMLREAKKKRNEIEEKMLTRMIDDGTTSIKISLPGGGKATKNQVSKDRDL